MIKSGLKAKLATVVLLSVMTANCSGKTYSTFFQPFDLIFGSRSTSANSADAVDLVSATPMTPTRVKLTFDEPITLGTAETVANYSIKAADGTSILVLAVTRDPFDSKVVYVDTAPQVSGTQYTVTVASIVGVDGSVLGGNNTASFTAPSNADQSGPTINFAQTTAIRTIGLTMSEALDATTANTTVTYQIHTNTTCTATTNSIAAAVRDPANFSKVTITTGSDIGAGPYYVKVTSLKDQWGNATTACSSAFSGYTAPAAPTVSSVISPSPGTILVTFSKAMDTTGTAGTALLKKENYPITACSGAER